ncbi:hypothetical protein HDV03_004133 [Kappamyces sp. JEL0829]|nr:hypothetical protein HDV03_004133 [Kappamyces sp. JEL0829]KAJ3373254.1 hypothetical protein HDU91_000651 [Kappamyces sp. JEL0680]
MSNEQLQNVGNQISSVFSSFTASLKPLGSEISKSVTQASQFAKEKIQGGSADATELPVEYRQLEEKVDRIKLVHELFLKVAKNYITPAYDYEPPALDKMADFATSIGSNAASLAERLSGTQLGGSKVTQQEVPPSLSHAFAKAAFQSAELVGLEEPFGAALKKFAVTQEKMGGFRLQQDQDAAAKFYYPFLKAMDGRIGESTKSRRNVLSTRLTYDSCRSRLKTAAPSRAEAVRAEMVQAEDEFVAAVDESMGKMKLVVENGDAIRCLSDLVAIQLQYHKAAFEALSELSPELDELVVTNEALYSPAN